MKILVYSPYLDILGGGEQYAFNFAACMAKHHQVYLVWPDKRILIKAAARFQLNLDSIIVIPFLPPRFHLKQFDLIFFVSDGSIPLLPFGQSILHFQVPFHHVSGKSLLNWLKLKFIDHIVCNSHFTKSHIDPEFGVSSQVIYPAVTIRPLNLPKENLILSVGRFTTTLHHKKQDALIRAFIELESQLPGWELNLAGGTETGSETLLRQLQDQIQGHRIKLLPNITTQVLNQLYAQAKFYWHAAGYEENLTQSPQKAEHFGISIVEAMGHGAVPLAFAAGGPQEIITPASGQLWHTLPQLTDQTLALIKDDHQWQQLSTAAVNRAQFFTVDKFCHEFYDLLQI